MAAWQHLARLLPQWFLTQYKKQRLILEAPPPTDPDAELSLLAWGAKYLAEHFTRPPSAMHVWLAARLDALRGERGSRINVIGPRGSAKSTLATLAYVLRAATAGWEPYIWIVSDTAEQARSHLENVKTELMENRLLRRAYRHSARRGRIWRQAAVALRNGVTIECFGTGQRIRGRRRRAERPTLIVCDDLQNDQHIDSALQRDHARRWFHGTLLPAGTQETNVVHLATALHVDALALELTRTPLWQSQTFRAIEEWPLNMELWHQWGQILCDVENPDSRQLARAFFEARQAEMEVGAVVLWPEVEDLYALMARRLESGTSAFDREKQSSPIDPTRCEWPEEYFTGDLWFETWPETLQIRTLALDPSKGADARHSDYSAYVMLGIDGKGLLLVEADLARRGTPQLVADGVELFRRFRPDRFGIEANQFQDLLWPLFMEEFRRAGMYAVSPCLIHNHISKRVRIRRLSPLLSLRRLRFKSQSPSTRLLFDQLRQFPQADHDDGPDALEMAVRMANELSGDAPDDGLGDRLV